MHQQVLNDTKKKMDQAIDHYKEELKQIRTGRANPSMLDGVQVEVYGSKMRLKDLAQVSAPEPRQLMVTPFDPQNVAACAKAIEEANMGLKSQVDGHLIRVNVPQMDEAKRTEMCKQAKALGEESKVRVRNARRDGNEGLKKLKNDKTVSEDVVKREEKTIQEFTDKACKDIDVLYQEKEKAIMTV